MGLEHLGRLPRLDVLLSDWSDDDLTHRYEQHGHNQAMVGPGRPESAPSGFAVIEAPPVEATRVHDLESLLAELDLIRERGYAISDEELEVGVVAASAPVTDFTGRIVAADVSADQRLDHCGRERQRP